MTTHRSPRAALRLSDTNSVTTTTNGFQSLKATAALLGAISTLAISDPSLADEGGASLYLPGSFASLAAVPNVPGWSVGLSYYHSRASEHDVTITADIAYGGVTYALTTPVLGGQLALSMVGAFGKMAVKLDDIDDSRLGFMDVTPEAALRWNSGVNNYLVYTLTNVPVGTYDRSRLANFSIEHWGQDAGAGYTYFDQQTGYEFSLVGGLTYNFENTKTNYQNGIDAHLEFGASKLWPNQIQLGVAGYVYQQLTADSGEGATLGSYKSRVAAVGPQLGYLFPVGDDQGYIGLRAYDEFAAENRPAGWNMWLSVSVPLRQL